MLIDGGFWTALFDRRVSTRLADDLVEPGYAVWNVEYRRIGEPGTRWPDTLTDVASAIDALEGLDPALDLALVAVVGHSAGGHLAARAAARPLLPAQALGARPLLGLRAACGGGSHSAPRDRFLVVQARIRALRWSAVTRRTTRAPTGTPITRTAPGNVSPTVVAAAIPMRTAQAVST